MELREGELLGTGMFRWLPASYFVFFLVYIPFFRFHFWRLWVSFFFFSFIPSHFYRAPTSCLYVCGSFFISIRGKAGLF
jgi:uncharacterized membrane-anchored protein YitT (DUF2179 family)